MRKSLGAAIAAYGEPDGKKHNREASRTASPGEPSNLESHKAALLKAVEQVPHVLNQVIRGVKISTGEILDSVIVRPPKEMINPNAAGTFFTKDQAGAQAGEVHLRGDQLHSPAQTLATLLHEFFHKSGVMMEGVAEFLATRFAKVKPTETLKNAVAATQKIYDSLGESTFMKIIREAGQAAKQGGHNVAAAFKAALLRKGHSEGQAEQLVKEASDYKKAA